MFFSFKSVGFLEWVLPYVCLEGKIDRVPQARWKAAGQVMKPIDLFREALNMTSVKGPTSF